MVFDLVAQCPEAPAQLMPVKICGKPMRAVHPGRVERLPAVLRRIERGVENHAMRMQMGIKFPAGFMPETCGHDVSGHPFPVLAGLPNSGFRPLLKFKHGLPDGLLMQRQNAGILKQPHHRNALGRCNREVEKDAPVGDDRIAFLTDRVHPLAQSQPGFRMLSFA